MPIVFFAMFCLIAGVWSGLTRIGWELMIIAAASHHGAIMVGGFLGTLIALERIIPLKKNLLYAIPVLNALSLGFFFTDYPCISIYVLIAASVLLAFVFLYYSRKQRTIVYVLMLSGAVCRFVGNVLLLSKLFYPLVMTLKSRRHVSV